MRKSRMISIIAASMLTATVVFTGCGGGGGSSSNLVSSSSTPTGLSSSTSSSVPQMTIKKVKVSDGYVLAATVKCKDTQGQDVAGPGVATENPGEYELSLTSECPVLCAKDGYIDINNNNQLDQGEPKAPKMEAPGNYNNINPYTAFIQNGVTPEKLAQACNLPVDTNFDIAIPESQDITFKKSAYKLAAVLAFLEKSGLRNVNIRSDAFPSVGCLPGQSCDNTSTTSSSSSSASNSSIGNSLTLTTIVSAFNSGKKCDEITWPAPLNTLFANIDASEKPEEVLSNFLKTMLGAYEVSSSSVSTSSSSSVAASECDNTAFPCGSNISYPKVSVSSVASSVPPSSVAISSEASSSIEVSSSSLPPIPMPDLSSSSEASSISLPPIPMPGGSGSSAPAVPGT